MHHPWSSICFILLVLLALIPSAAPAQTPPPGVYNYTLHPIAGQGVSNVVKFHPDGSYAVILETVDVVHVFDWDTRTAMSYDFGTDSTTIWWEDLAFDPSGDFAVLVARIVQNSGTDGGAWKMDDASYRQGDPQSLIFTEYVGAAANDQFVGIEYPWDGGNPVILGRSDSNSIALLREFDPVAGVFSGLFAATPTSAGADDLAFVNNEFGDWGILLVCGLNFTDFHYYTEISGIGEWRPRPGNQNTGNIARVAAHQGGDYALVVSWSARQIFRFEAGLMNNTVDAPWYSTKGIWGVDFQDGGTRALIVGRAGGTPLAAPVLEFRHDEYSLAGITDLSIVDFDSPPWLGTSNTYLFASAFRPGCDGGLIVGGDNGTSNGLVIEFENTLGTSCDSTASDVRSQSFAGLSLYQNVPNPFNPTTTIRFTVPDAGHVSLQVFDASGRAVRDLVDDRVPAGTNEVRWHGRNDRGEQVSSGIYFYRLTSGGVSQTKKMVLLK